MMPEDDLRATLRAHADEPAVQPDLLDQVRGGIRRSDRRRAAVLGAAAVLLTAIAVPVTIHQRRPPEPVLPAAWQRPDLTPAVFPFTPGWLPAGLGPAEVDQLGPDVLLSYDALTVEVGPKPPAWDAEGEDRDATVHGRPATIRTVAAGVYEGTRPGDRYVGIRWKHTDGRWVQIISSGPATESDVVRFADDLRADQTFTVTVDLNDVSLTDAELTRFAEGVTVQP